MRAQMLSHRVGRNGRKVGCHAQAGVCLSVLRNHQEGKGGLLRNRAYGLFSGSFGRGIVVMFPAASM